MPRIILIATAALLSSCASAPVERPSDWRAISKNDDFEFRYDQANIRYTEKGHMILKVRTQPMRPTDFTHQIVTHAIDCGEMKLATLDEVVYSGQGIVGRRHGGAQPYFVTVEPDTQLRHFMADVCVRFRDR